MKVKITGHVKKGFYIGPLPGDVDKDVTYVVKPTEMSAMTTSSNWYVDMHSDGDGAMFGRANKSKTKRHYWYTKSVDTIKDSKPVYVKVKGKKRVAATIDTSGISPVYKYIPHAQTSLTQHVNARVHGKFRMIRTLVLTPSTSQQFKAYSNSLPQPTNYIETKKDAKRRNKASKKRVDSYRSTYPISIIIELLYETSYQRMYGLHIPFRGVPIGKWRTIL
jgi:hypothetical protein